MPYLFAASNYLNIYQRQGASGDPEQPRISIRLSSTASRIQGQSWSSFFFYFSQSTLQWSLILNYRWMNSAVVSAGADTGRSSEVDIWFDSLLTHKSGLTHFQPGQQAARPPHCTTLGFSWALNLGRITELAWECRKIKRERKVTGRAIRACLLALLAYLCVSIYSLH